MKRVYIKTGKCIWYGRTKDDVVTFKHIQHILPKAMERTKPVLIYQSEKICL